MPRGQIPWNKGLTADPSKSNYDPRIAKTWEGKHRSEETKRKLSESNRGQKAWNKGLTKETDERVAKYAEKLKGRKFSKTHIANLSKAQRGQPQPWHKGDKNPAKRPEVREKISRSIKKWAENRKKKGLPIGRPPGFTHSEDWIREVIPKTLSKGSKRPNGAEQRLYRILETLFPATWDYVGNGRKMIGNMVPDFVHKTDNKVIEHYGDYWHRGEDPQDRIDAFAKHGWDCLVIWEHELKKVGLSNRLEEFVYG